MTAKKDTLFETLMKVNVNEHVKQKQKQSYLSWTYAWEHFKKLCPDADYEVTKQDSGACYYHDDFGVMVETKVTANGESHTMWLPVLDGAGNAMKKERYAYKVKKYEGKYPNAKWNGDYEDKWVDAATMFDINTAIMRCLVKNIAMFGLGLYIYSGEDIPDGDVINIAQMNEITNLISERGLDLRTMLGVFQIEKLTHLHAVNFGGALQWIEDNSLQQG